MRAPTGPTLWRVAKVWWQALSEAKAQDKPQVYVLEYGIDRPGEMDDMCQVVRPNIAMLISLAPNHLQQFGTYEAYAKEKQKLLTQATNTIVWCSNYPDIQRIAQEIPKTHTLSYGKEDERNEKSTHFANYKLLSSGLSGIEIQFTTPKAQMTYHRKDLLGGHHAEILT
jgi:UDP-N-acetylmuramyl pentapeptide synthase